MLLTKNQRELVKFQKQYTLITRVPKKGTLNAESMLVV
jgi:hypothetical protein